MPQLKSLTVKDGQATPANVVFAPWDIDRNGVAHLRNSNGVPLGDKNFTLALRRNDTKYKGRLLLVVPVVVSETINGVVVPRIARSAFVDVSVTFDQTSTMQERKDAMSMMGNALLGTDTLISQTFYDLEGIY